ncbi:MAG: flagellar biosynthetic protein FliR [Halanaerobiales bacterium]
MTLGDILSNYTYQFILLLFRYSGLFLITPIFSSRIVPSRIKVGLAFLFAIITLPLIQGTHPFPDQVMMILIEVLRELLIGLVIGFIAFLSFAVVQLAGRFVDMRMGFAIVNVADPIHGDTLPLMGQFKNVLVTLLFLAINGHHIMIRAVSRSFDIIPLGGAVLSNSALQLILRNAGDIFVLAFKVALPVVATLFVADIILGFMARTIPQLNVFVVGLPMKILVGLIVMMLSINIIINYTGDIFNEMFRNVFRILEMLS